LPLLKFQLSYISLFVLFLSFAIYGSLHITLRFEVPINKSIIYHSFLYAGNQLALYI